MAVVDVDNLATRMQRISELTETLLALHMENEESLTLADDVRQEIAIAQLQIRLFTGPAERSHRAVRL